MRGYKVEPEVVRQDGVDVHVMSSVEHVALFAGDPGEEKVLFCCVEGFSQLLVLDCVDSADVLLLGVDRGVDHPELWVACLDHHSAIDRFCRPGKTPNKVKTLKAMCEKQKLH